MQFGFRCHILWRLHLHTVFIRHERVKRKVYTQDSGGRVPGFVVVIGLVYLHSTLGKMHAHQLLSQTRLSFPVSYYLIMPICEGSV